jgi:hypothetical protein
MSRDFSPSKSQTTCSTAHGNITGEERNKPAFAIGMPALDERTEFR